MDLDSKDSTWPIDEALARHLAWEGLVAAQLLRQRLGEVRGRRGERPGLTLADHLFASGDLGGAALDQALARVRARQDIEAAHTPSLAAPAHFGPYRVVREVAQGGMGAVYEAVHSETGARVAIKTLIGARDAQSAAQLERFRREVEAMGRINHPAVARIHAAELGASGSYFAQEFLPGGTLAARCAAGAPEAATCAAWTVALAEGLAHCHARGILHRDLKPDNVVFDAYGAPKLVDFGLAYFLEGAARLTQTGALTGTPAYMSPEQARGSGTTDSRVDVYGLGAILYFLLAGEAPFDGSSLYVVLGQVLNQAPAPLPLGTPPWLERICWRALAKDPAARFQSAEEFASALRQGAGPRPRAGLRWGPALAGCLGIGALAFALSGTRARPDAGGASPALPLQAIPSATPSGEPSPQPSPLRPRALGPLGPASRSWGPAPGALGASGYGVALVGSLALTLERPWHEVRFASAQERYQPPTTRVRAWRLSDAQEVGGFQHEEARHLRASPDGARVALVGPREVFLYRAPAWETCERLAREERGQASGLAFSPSGRLLAVACETGALDVFDLVEGRLVSSLPVAARRVAFRGESQLLIATLAPPRVTLFDLTARSEVYSLEYSSVTDLRVSPGGERALVALYRDAAVVELDLKSGQELGRVASPEHVVGVVPDAAWRSALVFGQDRLLRFDLATRRVEARGQVRDRGSYGGALLPDGRALLVGAGQRLRLLGPSLELEAAWGADRDRSGPMRGLFYDLRGRPVAGDANGTWRLPGPGEEPESWIGVSTPGGLRAVCASRDRSRAWLAGGATVYEMNFAKDVLKPFGTAPADVAALALSPERQVGLAILARPWGGELVRASSEEKDGTWLRLLPPGSAQLEATLSIALGPEDRRGVSGDARGTLWLWDLERSAFLQACEDPQASPALSVVFDRRGRVWAGSRDGRIRRWDPQDPASSAALVGHEQAVVDLCLLPEDRLASASADGTFRVWDTETSRELLRHDCGAAGAPRLLRYASGRLLVGTLRGYVFEYAFP